MSSARSLLLFVTAVLLAGCPTGDESAPWYFGIWKLISVCGGYTGTCRDPEVDDRFQVIELSEDRFVEYRQGMEYRSVPVAYYEAQCITGLVRVNLSAEGGPDWCLYGDREHLGGANDNPDGATYGFRRCLSLDFC